VTGTTTLHVLSAGAAKAIVLALAQALRPSGVFIEGTFDAAGSIRTQFDAGARCDVLILPAAMQAGLAAQRRIDPASLAPLGAVPTGVAVPQGAPLPSVADADTLRAAFERASALYCPDIEQSTAGLHFVQMLRAMTIHDRVAGKLRAFANGARAMAALAATSPDSGAVGCTQVTEILYTDGVALAGPLPPPFELTTVYTVAASSTSAHRELARQFAARIAGADTRQLRAASGFAAV
jgi:molybdate transport system substrate-binding protein